MRLNLLRPLIICMLILAACDKPEEIKPVLPAIDTTATVTKTEAEAEVPEKAPEKTESVDSAKIQYNAAEYQYKKFRNMPYRILLPKKYDPAKKYPLLIFLHGIGERGTDNKNQLTWGSKLYQADSVREKYPAFVIFPQCPTTHKWLDNEMTETLKGMIDDVAEDYNVDNNRLYAGGLSMGAYGTYAMVAQYPGLFAAAVAISGDGDSSKADGMAKTRWRIFGGGKDKIVSSDLSEKMAAALKRSGASVSLTVYPEADHPGSWIKAFAEPDFCSWLFSATR
jgi:predicted peptidase